MIYFTPTLLWIIFFKQRYIVVYYLLKVWSKGGSDKAFDPLLVYVILICLHQTSINMNITNDTGLVHDSRVICIRVSFAIICAFLRTQWESLEK